MEYDTVVIGGGTAGYIAGSVLGRKEKSISSREGEVWRSLCKFWLRTKYFSF
ncbi:MAG: hypothetical protein QXF93_01635 [Saccharolobus sp.]